MLDIFALIHVHCNVGCIFRGITIISIIIAKRNFDMLSPQTNIFK